MPDIDYLRQAMHAETTDLPMNIPIDRIHRRARGLRTLRVATVVAASTLVISGVAVSGFALFDRAPSAGDLYAGAPAASSPSSCEEIPALGSTGARPLLGPIVETGVSIEGPDQKRYDVVFAVNGERNDPLFNVAFRDRQTGDARPWDMGMLPPPGPDGGFTAKGVTWWFESSQLPLAAGRVLDMGIYSGTAHRITVASEGRSSDANVTQNTATGWTLFWVERTAKPLPAEANVGPDEYQGPERLTITAYDAAGRRQHTVTGGFHIGSRTQNPRDNSPDPHGSPTPGVPVPCS